MLLNFGKPVWESQHFNYSLISIFFQQVLLLVQSAFFNKCSYSGECFYECSSFFSTSALIRESALIRLLRVDISVLIWCFSIRFKFLFVSFMIRLMIDSYCVGLFCFYNIRNIYFKLQMWNWDRHNKNIHAHIQNDKQRNIVALST